MAASERALMFVGAHPDDETFGPGGTLARYAAEGVKVVYTCATRGEAGTVDASLLHGFPSLGDLRWAELTCAARQLGLSAVVPLGYRDSGMPGAPDNEHARALVRAPLDDLVRAVVGAIREAKPQVVITFDPIGGYRHPDHIAIHRATAQAFRDAGEARRFPETGRPFAPGRLYYWVPPRGRLRLAVRALRLLGRDPARVGRNRDVDLADIAAVEFPVHARIRIPRSALVRKHAAFACHRSQLTGASLVRRLRWAASVAVAADELFMRAHPAPAAGGAVERDLFGGLP